MNEPMFDTHRYYHVLKDGGFTERQAEALTAALGQAVGGAVATKTDVAELETELKSDIAELRTELKSDVAELRAELKSDVAELRTELKSDIAELRAELKSDIAELRLQVQQGSHRLYLQVSGTMMLLLALTEFASRHFK